MTKKELRSRPIIPRARHVIEAHLHIVFAALAVSRAVQQRTGLAMRNAIRRLLSATIAISGAEQTSPSSPSTTSDNLTHEANGSTQQE